MSWWKSVEVISWLITNSIMAGGEVDLYGYFSWSWVFCLQPLIGLILERFFHIKVKLQMALR